ncbi:MAG: hypothetical protein KO254_01235 [Methanoculleus marisnigri]|nr:hypothetical protein [Methanoculleus marisnigri]
MDDIKQPQILTQILEFRLFKFFTGSIICSEIQRSQNITDIEGEFSSQVNHFDYYNYGELLRPFLSVNEIEKGEHEVIVISYVLHLSGCNILAILDDESPRTYFKSRFPELSNKVTGTIGFIEKCTCSYGVFQTSKGTTILSLIADSKFRVKKHIVDGAIKRIMRSEDVKTD